MHLTYMHLPRFQCRLGLGHSTHDMLNACACTLVRQCMHVHVHWYDSACMCMYTGMLLIYM